MRNCGKTYLINKLNKIYCVLKLWSDEHYDDQTAINLIDDICHPRQENFTSQFNPEADQHLIEVASLEEVEVKR